MAERRLIDPANWPYFDHSKMPYSLAAEKDGILFLSGQTAERENPETGKIECKGDAVEQLDVIMEKHKLLIEASGGKPEDMTNRTVFTSAAGSPPLSHYKRAFRSSPTVTPEMWRSNFGPNYAPGTGLYMQGNLNLNADLERGPGSRHQARREEVYKSGFPALAGEVHSILREWN